MKGVVVDTLLQDRFGIGATVWLVGALWALVIIDVMHWFSYRHLKTWRGRVSRAMWLLAVAGSLLTIILIALILILPREQQHKLVSARR